MSGVCIILKLNSYLYDMFTVFVSKGLLTVNPRERLTMRDLLRNQWINGTNLEVLSTTPLATPEVLSLTCGTVNTIQSQITATLSAFHKAHRDGFRLQDVSNAPLVQRRKRMREEGSSGSTDSSRAGTPIPPFTNVPSSLAVCKGNSALSSNLALQPGSSGSQDGIPILHLTNASSEATSPAPGISVIDLDLQNQPPPLSVNVTSESRLRELLLQSDSTASLGFGPHSLPSSQHHFVAATESSSPICSNSPTSSRQTDESLSSSSSRGSTPQRSPASRIASVTSLGFSPAAAGSNENSCHEAEPTVAASASVISHSLAVGSSSSNKRKHPDSFDCQSYSEEDGDDDCVVVGVTSASDSCRESLRNS